MGKKKLKLAELSPAQQEIIELFWEHGELTATHVLEILSQDRDIARNTVRTLIERMEVKGWLTHRSEGRTFYYSATQPRRASIAHKVSELLENVCGGSPETLVAALLDQRRLSEKEIERIEQMLADARKQKKRK